jgi:hypothetical protein
MYEAINRRIVISRGEVLAYLNTGDPYLPRSVDVAVRAVQEPGVELIYGDFGILRGERNSKLRRFNIQFKPDFNLRHYSFVATTGNPAVFWSRSLTERIGPFDTGSAVPRFLPSCRLPEDPTELITSAIVGRVISALEEESTAC